MKTYLSLLILILGLSACTADPVPSLESNPAAGSVLTGVPMPITTDQGEALVGGDAVAPDETPGEVSFTVLGSNYAYDLTEITVQEGDQVTVNFRSVDGLHDWVVDEFSAATQRVNTDEETWVTFTADKVGEFEFYCSVGNHRQNGMVGRLIVD